ncbi:YqzE family protein [Paenibacillus xerothermodurans]|uniref:YqzE family protein n=1 Tax=Paenibacillus xerothermodurans TaxID=1977292 RepID=A0A2W1N940_PAEXE|nr:YqzE family protein [Paenibacillus xerothermodurans]PZE20917.1 YqzE family protein [Paenibacillus xerothermodurans]
MAKGDELVKYVAEQFIDYIETPREVRKEAKASRKERRERWQYRWFGMLPVALRMWTDEVRKRK